jgi:hypothetical protein
MAVVMPLAAPAVASATPLWRMNGVLAGTTKKDVIQFGTLTLHNALLGEWKCSVLAGMRVWNEGGNGLASVESWNPYDCSSASCPGAAFVTAEEAVKLEETTNAKGEIEYSAKRGLSTLPWPAETVAPEAGVSRLAIRKIGMILECPAQAVATKFSGILEPRIVNGIQNGLSPSHVLFEGEGGKTGWLNYPCGDCGYNLFLSGELTTLGTMGQELITAY